jgi:hypothetical protein
MGSKLPAVRDDTDIENIIHNIHEEISIGPEVQQNRIETISLDDDDDEITSILESVTSDVMASKKQGASRKQQGGRRTLNL